MNKLIILKNKLYPLLNPLQRDQFEKSEIELNDGYTLFDYLYNNGYLNKTINEIDNTFYCIKLLNYLLNNNDNKSFNNFIEKIIDNGNNFLLDLILKYFYIDRTLVLNLLNIYKNKKPLSNQQIKDSIEKRENKYFNKKTFYTTALINDKYSILGTLLDYNHSEDIIDTLNNFNVFRQLDDKKKINYDSLKVIIDEGRLDVLKILVSNGLDVTFCDRFNNPPLIYAIRAENYEIIKFLIDYYTKIPKLPLKDISNLMCHGKLDIIQLLFKGKLNIKLLNFKGKYDIKKILLKEAVLSGNNEIVDYLIECGVKSSYFQKIFMDEDILRELYNGNLDILKILIENDVDVNVKNDFGETLLDNAINNRRINIIKCLINDCSNSYDIHNQLLNDIMNGKFDILKILIDNHIEINLKNNEKDEITPLIYTMECKDHQNDKIIEFVKNFGFNIYHNIGTNQMEIEDNILCEDSLHLLKSLLLNNNLLNNRFEENLILSYTFKSRKFDLIDYIIESGKKIEKVNNNIEVIKPLIENNDLELLNYLIENNLNINSEDENGDSPLIYSIKDKNMDMIKYFIDHKAKIDQVKDETIKYIIHNNMIDTLKYLVLNNININHYNPLKHAIDEQKIDIIKYLLEISEDFEFIYNNSCYFKKLFDIVIKRNDIDILENLSTKKFNFNYKDNEGFSPLIYAIKERNAKVSQYLLENNANIEIVDDNIEIINKLILNCMDCMEVERQKLFNLLTVLVNNNFNINKKDKEGHSLLYNAINKKKHNEIINYLKNYITE